MSRLLFLVLTLSLLSGCGGETQLPEETSPTPPAPIAETDGWFHQVTQERGIDFVHQDGRTGELFYVETAASGGGFLDYDGDGDLDVYLLNGATTPFPDDGPAANAGAPRNALFANDGQGRFTEVAEAAGVADAGYGMGMCTGDYDGDGTLDLFVTNFGPDRLFRGLGDGRFEETAEKAGVAGRRWGTNCSFADIDLDGDLDLYVANYVNFRFDKNPRCGDSVRGIWSYCRPAVFDGQADYLYINQGDGTFAEEGRERGIDQGTDEKSFGVLISDLNGDDAPEILVANDGTLNRLYLNDGRGVFTDEALISGVAADRDGAAGSGMGLDLGDADGDGRFDLLVTNYSFETNTLYLRRGEGLYFEDSTAEAGLEVPTHLPVGWGTSLFDADNDGDLDLAVVNGHVMDNIELFEDRIGYPQPNLLLENDGTGNFHDVSTTAGSAFTTARVSRALATGDFDDDGRLDLLVTNTNEAPDLLLNALETSHHWLGVRLRGPAANRFAIGARVRVFCDGDLAGLREVRSGGSFLAQSDLRLHFGLGDCSGPVTAQIRWPGGAMQDAATDQIDRYWQIDYEPTSGPRDVSRSR